VFEESLNIIQKIKWLKPHKGIKAERILGALKLQMTPLQHNSNFYQLMSSLSHLSGGNRE
jgi:hypothetical protein